MASTIEIELNPFKNTKPRRSTNTLRIDLRDTILNSALGKKCFRLRPKVQLAAHTFYTTNPDVIQLPTYSLSPTSSRTSSSSSLKTARTNSTDSTNSSDSTKSTGKKSRKIQSWMIQHMAKVPAWTIGDKENLMTIPGLMGSHLEQELPGIGKKEVWLNLHVLAGVRQATFDLNHEGEYTVKPTGSVSSILGLIDVGGRLKQHFQRLHDNQQLNYCDWSYNWLESPTVSGDLLVEKLKQIYDETGKGTALVAHSMGGIVLCYALAKAMEINTDLITRIVLVGSPLGGAPGVIGKFKSGEFHGLSKATGTPEAMFQRKSLYSLAPRHSDCFVDREGNSHNINICDPDQFHKFGLSPASTPENKAFLDRVLAANAEMHKFITDSYNPAKAASYPPIALVISTSIPTPIAAIVDSPEQIGTLREYRDIAWAAGDGICPAASACAVPGGWAKHVVHIEESPFGHIGMLEKHHVRNALAALREHLLPV